MLAALFEMESWVGKEHYITTGKNPYTLLNKFQKVQDLYCMLDMGREMEEDAQGVLDILMR